MKNNYKLILLSFTILIGLFCYYININNDKTDNKKFKIEYESLNGKTNNQGKSYPNVNISTNNMIKYSNFEEVKNILTKGSGIIYFGFPECPWCRNIIGTLIETAQEENIETIYYFNALSIRDKKHLDENKNIIIDEEGTNEYKELIEIMKDYLTPYEGLENENIKRLYFPTVVFIKDGKIKDIHIGTIEEQKDPYIPLTENQKNQLKYIYKQGIEKIKNNTCSDKC